MGNGAKAAMKRERNAGKQNAGGKSQLKVNQQALNIQCSICRQPFLSTTKEGGLMAHISSKHPDKDIKTCFPSWNA